jgi:toxin ParE1/3/4
MKTHAVRFTIAAVDDLTAIFDFVAERASVRVAEAFVARLEAACLALDVAPHRGTIRDDLRPGLRTVGVERRATMLFTVDDAKAQVVILGVFYGGRDVDAEAVSRTVD